ncbi:hypothetical protein Cgig2_028993 [Carnegiea gigantea]|uniref:Uncharacterized protein n=1 Tax=Carnegiea gigantea TaxID=171969 RepID=A0A9Q1JIB0_9CARY|nr:hypothetical protein Cgig2_028993 [Carnegiea gigantea]
MKKTWKLPRLYCGVQRISHISPWNQKTISYLLLVQFQLDDEKVRKLYRDQKMAMKCYYVRLKSLGRKEEAPQAKCLAQTRPQRRWPQNDRSNASVEKQGKPHPEPTSETRKGQSKGERRSQGCASLSSTSSAASPSALIAITPPSGGSSRVYSGEDG